MRAAGLTFFLNAAALDASSTSAVAAEDGPECFSPYTKTNVCEYARTAQAATAPTLPMKLNANLTIATVAAVGPRLIYTAVLNLTAAEAEAMANGRGISMQDWAAKMGDNTRNSVCSMDALAAFVRLGGEVQYLYKTADGRVLFSPLVQRSDCLNSR